MSRLFDADPERLYLRTDDYGWTPLHMATIRNNVDLVRLMLSYGKESKECIDKRDRWYHYDGSHGCMRHEFESDVYPHRLTKGPTALHYACMIGNMEIAEMLLHAGADYEKEDEMGLLPGQYISEEGEETKVKDAWRNLVEERRRRDEEAKRINECKEGKSDDKPTTTSTGVTVQKGLDEDASYTISEFFTYLEIIYNNKSTLQTLVSIESAIGSKIIGQKGPVRNVANAIRLREHGWVDPDRPLVLLFLGSSGVGKTEVAKQIALYMANKDARANGKRDKTITEIEADNGFVRIDMSEYQQSHTVANLTGALNPPNQCDSRHPLTSYYTTHRVT